MRLHRWIWRKRSCDVSGNVKISFERKSLKAPEWDRVAATGTMTTSRGTIAGDCSKKRMSEREREKNVYRNKRGVIRAGVNSLASGRG